MTILQPLYISQRPVCVWMFCFFLEHFHTYDMATCKVVCQVCHNGDGCEPKWSNIKVELYVLRLM